MTGALVSIDVQINDREIAAQLRRLQRRVANMRPALDEIGARLETSTDRRFETETDPDGQEWLRSGRAEAENGQTLTDTARLRQSITRSVRDHAVAVGTNVVYGAIHQFGGKTRARTIRPKRAKALFWPGAAHPVKEVQHPGSTVPKRSFLGVSTADRRAILDILARHVREALA